MKLKITTQSGSVYIIDPTAKTWERVHATALSGTIRTTGGVFEEMYPITVGNGLLMFCPPLEMNGPPRMIYTSNVTEIEPLEEIQ